MEISWNWSFYTVPGGYCDSIVKSCKHTDWRSFDDSQYAENSFECIYICIYNKNKNAESTYPFFTNMGVPKMDLWFGLNPISAGVFGLPVGIITIFVVSLLTAPPDKETQALVEHVRYPSLKGDTYKPQGAA